jgi:hypothetical protein
MFPSWFSDDVVSEFSTPGDVVLDPFAGRGTALFSAVKSGRYGIGAELSPVGWVYAKTKLHAAEQRSVRARLDRLAEVAADTRNARGELPKFFEACFSQRVRRFLVEARARLNWRSSVVDRTLMAHILVYLHGKRTAALSNQMRQTKAMAPDYSVRWWADRELDPPDIDPVEFLARRIEWRHRHGAPPSGRGSIVLGDCTRQLGALMNFVNARKLQRASLLLTSPPYFGVTNYHYDQWLRLWMLGGPAQPEWIKDPHRNRFENATEYAKLLSLSLGAASRLMRRNAVVYVRTGAAESSLRPLMGALADSFPGHQFEVLEQNYSGPSQSALFKDVPHARLGEVDVVGVRRNLRRIATERAAGSLAPDLPRSRVGASISDSGRSMPVGGRAAGPPV